MTPHDLRFTLALTIAISATVSSASSASFVPYSDFTAWQNAGGPYTTIGFDEVPDFTFLSDEYSQLGVAFPSMWEYTIVCPGCNNYPIDGAGLKANWFPVELVFDTPQFWIGMHHPGDVRIQLYDGSTLLYQSPVLGGGGNVFFSGVVATTGFNRAIIKDPFGGTFDLDNLYFGGPPVPAPAASAVLAGLVVGGRRRRE